MKQGKLTSFLEAVTGVLIGFSISITVQIVGYPLLGVKISVVDNLYMCTILTVVSIVRTYVIRRFFETQLHKFIVRFSNGLNSLYRRYLNLYISISLLIFRFRGMDVEAVDTTKYTVTVDPIEEQIGISDINNSKDGHSWLMNVTEERDGVDNKTSIEVGLISLVSDLRRELENQR